MKYRLFTVALLTALLAIPGCIESSGDGGSGPPPIGGQMSPAELGMAMEVLNLVNQERAAASLPPLVWDDDASQVAYYHCQDMDYRNFFDHTNPDGLEPWDRLTLAGVSWSTAGENIARGQLTPAAVMTAWMNSPGHRANILHASFTHLGVGVHLAAGGPWWTQVFFTP